MTQYLVELYLPRLRADGLAEGAARARAAARAMTAEGRPVRFVRTVFVPEDEVCFYVYEAESADAAGEASRRAELPFERVLEAVSAE
jgi:hypothetical protein